jgi:hypothetical protein
MKNQKIISTLVLLIIAGAIVATLFGIFSGGGNGEFEYESIRGEKIIIYGRGLYQHMSSDVAIQGIAQDYVTLFAGVPLLFLFLFLARKKSLKGLFLLSGTIGYFFVTYLFYTAMGMYNKMFLVYLVIMGASFFAFILTLFSYDVEKIKKNMHSEKLLKNAGIFLVVNSTMVASLWLSIVVPPLFNGLIVPPQVQHYTTLIVQGFDLGLLLPIAFVSGFLAIKKNGHGYLFTIINIIFLSLLMTALTSKIIFMAGAGVNVIPAVFIMPTINVLSIVSTVLLLKNIKITKAVE